MAKKMSKTIQVTERVIQNNRHEDTLTISRRRSVLSCQQAALEDEIADLTTRIAIARRALRVVDTEIDALTGVIGRR